MVAHAAPGNGIAGRNQVWVSFMYRFRPSRCNQAISCRLDIRFQLPQCVTVQRHLHQHGRRHPRREHLDLFSQIRLADDLAVAEFHDEGLGQVLAVCLKQFIPWMLGNISRRWEERPVSDLRSVTKSAWRAHPIRYWLTDFQDLFVLPRSLSNVACTCPGLHHFFGNWETSRCGHVSCLSFFWGGGHEATLNTSGRASMNMGMRTVILHYFGRG